MWIWFSWQWSSVNIKKTEVFIKNKQKKSIFSPCILKHITAPTKTNGSINNIDIIHSDAKFEETKK